MDKKSQKGHAEGPLFSRSEQRDVAKAGMITSLGTLVLTGFFRFKGAGLLHTWAGLFLVGFSLWHHVLNQPRKGEAPGNVKRQASNPMRSVA
jgi:hypothetical protein